MKKWRGCELLYLNAFYPTTHIGEVAKALGRSKASVKTRIKLMRIKKATGFGGKKIWTAADNEVMVKEYPKGDLTALAARFGTTLLALYHHAREIGVKRDPELVAEQTLANAKKLAQLEGSKLRRFVKGQISHNKGKKQHEFMSPEKIENTKATRFRKGQDTHNRVPIGTERTTPDGYIEVKVADMALQKNWKLKQRLVYEENVGPIPEGYIVEFIDGVRTNFNPSNLRAVSRRENAIRNKAKFEALPPDLKENIKLLNNLKKQLK